MNALEARDTLAGLVRAKSNPTLCPPELDYCLSKARTLDAHGNMPGDAAWCGAWDMNRAAYYAWCLKRDKAANYHDINVDGRVFSASQVYAQLDKSAESCRRRLMATIVCGSAAWAASELPLTCTCTAL